MAATCPSPYMSFCQLTEVAQVDLPVATVHLMTGRRWHDYDAMYAADTSPPWSIEKPQPARAAIIDSKSGQFAHFRRRVQHW